MFKGLIFLIAMATIGRAGVVGVTPIENMTNGIGGVPATLTYALNQALTGTSSTAIDLSGTSGMWLSLSSTGSALVKVYFSNGNLTYTTGAIEMYSLTSPGSYAINPKARYVSFYNYSASSSGTAVKTSAFYSLVQPATTTVSGSVSTVVTGFSPAGTTSYQVLSAPATTINLTSSAGANLYCMVCLASNGGAAAGFKMQFSTSATYPVNLTSTSVGHYVAATTTSQCWGPYKAGTILHMAGVAATSSVIVDVNTVQ